MTKYKTHYLVITCVNNHDRTHLIHDRFARRMDRMEMRHKSEIIALQGRLDRYCQRAEERGMRFRIRLTSLRSVLLVLLLLPHRLVMRELLRKAYYSLIHLSMICPFFVFLFLRPCLYIVFIYKCRSCIHVVQFHHRLMVCAYVNLI